VVTGNQIFDNSMWNVDSGAYASGAQTLRLNFTGNWWGTTNVTSIASSIDDLMDNPASTAHPLVDFLGFLDGPTGNVVAGQYLLGPLAATTTTLTAGQTYDVPGTLIVGAGKSLTIPAGTVLRFHNPGQTAPALLVDGTLSVQGTGASPAVLTSSRATPVRGDWQGIVLRAGSTGSVIEHAQIEWAVRAVEFASGAVGSVRNSTLRNFSEVGLYFTSSPASVLISANVIDNLDDQGRCLQLSESSPTIQGNTIRNCESAFWMTGNSTAPLINNNNIITSHARAFSIGGSSTSPQPVVTGNQIFDNSMWNVDSGAYASGAQTLRVNFTGNWWGTTDVVLIASRIDDLTDNPTSIVHPTVDFRGFLDGPNGNVVAGQYLLGPFAAAATTLTAGETYDVLGTLVVGAGKSLTIPAGTIVRFQSGALVVEGALNVQGTEAAPVRFVSRLADPTKGDWYGIEVHTGATSVVIEHAIIEWAWRALSVTNANVILRNSVLRNFADAAIWMSGASSASQLVGNYIDNLDGTGYGIYLSASSPAITDNQIYRTLIGIYAVGPSNPVITGNAISNNGRGIVLDGNNSDNATDVPNPVINGNDIFGNAGAQLEVYRYGASNPVVIDATGNWWGTASPQAGAHIRFTSGSQSSAVDFTNPANAPRTRPVSGNIALSLLYFSPNGDAIQDVLTVSGTLNQAANWVVTIRDAGFNPVRAFTGSGTTISASWNGQNGGGQVLPDGTYTVEVTASSANGSGVVGSRLATLDNSPPLTVIASPAANATVANVLTVPVSGSVSDPNLTQFSLDYGAGTSPSTWTTLNSQSSGVTSGLLGTWVVSNTTGSPGLAAGPYVLRLVASDKAGNTAWVLVPVTLDLLKITGVSQNLYQNLKLMRPLAGEQLQVTFTVSMPATVTMRIYPEAGGGLVREISQTFSTSGAKTLTWDGRNGIGAYVPEEAYSYSLHATNGSLTAAFDPPAPGGIGSGSGSVDARFDVHRNDFWKMTYSMNHYGRIRMQVNDCTKATYYPYNWVAYPPGEHPLIWDGRDVDGSIVSGTCDIYFDAPLLMKANSVIVRGTKPAILGGGTTPNIEVQSTPYRIAHSYEQISRITYRLSLDSYVTVKLLPPGVTDPASPAAIVLTNGVLQTALSGGQPADYAIEWKGYDDLDTNNITVADEGTYTFAIQATSVATGATSLYRGALTLWQ
jgi:parallel beta-helix repeat protein